MFVTVFSAVIYCKHQLYLCTYAEKTQIPDIWSCIKSCHSRYTLKHRNSTTSIHMCTQMKQSATNDERMTDSSWISSKRLHDSDSVLQCICGRFIWRKNEKILKKRSDRLLAVGFYSDSKRNDLMTRRDKLRILTLFLSMGRLNCGPSFSFQ